MLLVSLLWPLYRMRVTSAGAGMSQTANMYTVENIGFL